MENGAAEQMLSIDEAAQRLGLKPVTVRQWVAMRRIGSVRLGRRLLIPIAEISRLIQQNYIPARESR